MKIDWKEARKVIIGVVIWMALMVTICAVAYFMYGCKPKQKVYHKPYGWAHPKVDTVLKMPPKDSLKKWHYEAREIQRTHQ